MLVQDCLLKLSSVLNCFAEECEKFFCCVFTVGVMQLREVTAVTALTAQ